MKKILFLGIILLGVFLIYLSTFDRKIFYLSLGDELSVGYNEFNTKDYGYSDYVKEYLEKQKKLEVYVNSYFKKDLRTVDLIEMIEENEKTVINGKTRMIKNALIKADLVTLSIGNNDIVSKLSLYENYSKKEIYDYLDSFLIDLENLIKLVKEYCKEEIIFIGFYNTLDENTDSYYKYLNDKSKKMMEKYDITYLDIFDSMKKYKNNSLYPNKDGYIYIGKQIEDILKQEILE